MKVLRSSSQLLTITPGQKEKHGSQGRVFLVSEGLRGFNFFRGER